MKRSAFPSSGFYFYSLLAFHSLLLFLDTIYIESVGLALTASLGSGLSGLVYGCGLVVQMWAWCTIVRSVYGRWRCDGCLLRVRVSHSAPNSTISYFSLGPNMNWRGKKQQLLQ